MWFRDFYKLDLIWLFEFIFELPCFRINATLDTLKVVKSDLKIFMFKLSQYPCKHFVGLVSISPTFKERNGANILGPEKV